jgi:hypothetical protein
MHSFFSPVSALLLCLGLLGLAPSTATWAQEAPDDAVVSASEDDPVTLTLSAAVGMALKQNLDLQAAQLD